MNPIAEDILQHYGMPKRSGRYPWGSGDDPYQHSGDFLSRIEELKNEGFNDTEIAKSMGLTTTQFRTQRSLAKDERRAIDVATARGLRDKGCSLNEIAQKMGFANDSSVRSLLNENSEARMNQARATADFLKKQVEEKGMIDVGVGVEKELGNISREKLKQALYILELEGYPLYKGGIPQVTNPGKQTNVQVLCPPGTEHKDIYNFENIRSVGNYTTHDSGETFEPTWVYPKSMDSKRLAIRYAEDGGKDKDGLVEIRRGVDDISLGDSRYAQVRILVDDSKYIKGMAVYNDDLPDGVDIVFNTNKSSNVAKMDVLKDIKKDPDNPFGSLIKSGINDPTNPTGDSFKGGQSYYIDKNGKKQLSLINKRSEEGDWTEWSDKLSAQFLSKQNISLIKKQLGLSIADKQLEFDDIMSLNNPTIKKSLLKSFSDDCDAAAVHLKAASLPRQRYKVILPITTLKDDEIYAPDYKPGEKVALVRYPHGGTFEIPILTVNNKHPDAKKTLGNAFDAVGINSRVAERLSGADFDGDTVMVIPTGGKIKISSTPPLEGLEGFDAKLEYGGKKAGTFKAMNDTQNQMGRISNLITDMTLKGATQDELARAVRHSMVVIDAEKHKLDYKQSELDNGISSLKKKYQGSVDTEGKYHEGASTLISRSKSKETVLKRKGSPKINDKSKSWYDPSQPEGALLWNSVQEEYVDKKTGKIKFRTQDSTKMAETNDARTLSSGRLQEEAYADYANKMKAMGNEARKALMSTGNLKYSAAAKKEYQQEVDSLTAKLNISLKNSPRERQAQAIANSVVSAKRKDNPDMTSAEIKKANQQALVAARATVGAKRIPVTVTDKEWEAIQKGAISENVLQSILKHVEGDELRKRATPRTATVLTTAKINKINSMNDSGYSLSDIAESLGVSTSVITNYLKTKGVNE